MVKGVFYSVGVGPGDPLLITLKAVETIRICDVIISPDSGCKDNVALEIAWEYIRDKRVEFCSMPMTRDKKVLDIAHDEAASRIAGLLDDGLDVAFLTLGDPSIYSTAMYVHKRLAVMGFATKIIPGVPSFCAAAAARNTSLCEGAEPMHIIPASYGGRFLELDGTKVLMKPGKEAAGIVSSLKALSGIEAFIVRRASMDREMLFGSPEDFDNNEDYFSIIVVKQA